MRLALVTCLTMPETDEDERPLRDALRAAGHDAEVVAWDDPNVRWNAFDRCILRSTWNYHRAPDAFLAWVDRTGRETELLNPPDVVRWNAHKGYLVELADRGIPVTPTALVRQGSTRTLADVLAERGWTDVVVKPAVSAGSFATLRAAGATAEAERHLARLVVHEDALVQAYLPSVEGYGERSIIFIGGEPSHAMRKSPRFAGSDEAVTGPFPIADDELALARTLLGPFGERLLYARVDLARDDADRPLLMELELIEPSLFLSRHPPALARLVTQAGR